MPGFRECCHRTPSTQVQGTPGEKVGDVCVHEEVKDYLISCVTLCTTEETARLNVGVVPGLTY